MISYLIKDYMRSRGLTLKDFSQQLGFSDRQIRDWINLKVMPKEFAASCLCSLFTKGHTAEHKQRFERLFWDAWRQEQQLRRRRKKAGL